MAYVSIPKDLTRVRTKFLLGLTKRQTVCFGMAVIIGLPIFFTLKSVLPPSGASFIMVLAMLPCFLFAMYEKNGQPLEKYLKNIINVMFKRPKIRTYQTYNLYEVLARQNQLEREVESIVSKKKY